ncbi:MerR family transcriptional regulator [Spirochaetia bacterium]|nr:MerR family transcriptional regulator [Spirochaetia bacterium]
MAFYGIRDVERLLKVKVHVLRYWEQEIPLIQPKKDVSGKLRYSSRDLQIFLRLKYLLYDRHFTVEGAREELFREASGDQQNLRAQIAALRSDLVDLCFLIQNKDAPRDTP